MLAKHVLFCLSVCLQLTAYLKWGQTKIHRLKSLVAEQLPGPAQSSVTGCIASSLWEPDFIPESASLTEVRGWVTMLRFVVQVSGGVPPS